MHPKDGGKDKHGSQSAFQAGAVWSGRWGGMPGQLYFKIEKAHLPQELALPPVSDGDSQVQHVGRWIETHASQRQLSAPSSNPARQEGSKAAHGQAVINLWSPVIPMKTLCILICPVEINQSGISVAGGSGWLCFFVRTQGSVYTDCSITRFSVSLAREASELTCVSPLAQSLLDKSPSLASRQASWLCSSLQTQLLAPRSLWEVGQTTPTSACESRVGKCPDVSQKCDCISENLAFSWWSKQWAFLFIECWKNKYAREGLVLTASKALSYFWLFFLPLGTWEHSTNLNQRCMIVLCIQQRS